jgi:hypothetical protein
MAAPDTRFKQSRRCLPAGIVHPTAAANPDQTFSFVVGVLDIKNAVEIIIAD